MQAQVLARPGRCGSLGTPSPFAILPSDLGRQARHRQRFRQPHARRVFVIKKHALRPTVSDSSYLYIDLTRSDKAGYHYMSWCKGLIQTQCATQQAPITTSHCRQQALSAHATQRQCGDRHRHRSAWRPLPVASAASALLRIHTYIRTHAYYIPHMHQHGSRSAQTCLTSFPSHAHAMLTRAASGSPGALDHPNFFAG